MTWVLVDASTQGPLYVRYLYVDAAGRTSVDWTDDSDQAVRFFRREDAESIATGVAGERLEAVEPVVGESDRELDDARRGRDEAHGAFVELDGFHRDFVARFERVIEHAARCPVGYRVGEAGDLLLWIPDDRPQRGLQFWLRELDKLLGRPTSG